MRTFFCYLNNFEERYKIHVLTKQLDNHTKYSPICVLSVDCHLKKAELKFRVFATFFAQHSNSGTLTLINWKF